MKKLLEVCVDSLASARAAQAGGADRLEFCSALAVGGLSPYPELLRQIKAECSLPVRCLMRPRAGDFLYTKDEIDLLCAQIHTLRDTGADGFVIGALTPDGALDKPAMAQLLDACGDKPVTLHRCIDVSCDLAGTYRDAATLGIDTVLTSGGAASCRQGTAALAKMLALRNELQGPEVLIGAGVSAAVITELRAALPGARAFHLSGKKLVESGKIPEAFVDESAFRVLMMKNQLGLFENPFAGLGKSGKLTLYNRTKAYQMASESCVLLKNEEILPLCQKQKVIWAGPYVTSKEFLSRWAIFGEHEPVETIEAILQDKKMNAECIPGCRMLSEEECKIWQVEQDNSDEEIDEQWLETITREDTVVCVLGEHESQSGEAASRAFLTLPEEQQMLFEKIAKRTDNIVTVVISGRPLDLRRISEKSKAVIMAWRPGTMGAEAITDLVYGITNPSGKLAVSIPWCVGQVPISYWDIKTGHVLTADNLENRFTSRYMDIPNTPLYPFGFGLSYTEFDVSDVEVKTEQDKRVHVHCKVSNTGNVAGAEVVQCYYETLHASVVRPMKELVRFQKVFLDPGEKKDVDFFIDQEEFSYYGKNMEIVSSGMQLRISAGNSSDHEWGSSELYI